MRLSVAPLYALRVGLYANLGGNAELFRPFVLRDGFFIYPERHMGKNVEITFIFGIENGTCEADGRGVMCRLYLGQRYQISV